MAAITATEAKNKFGQVLEMAQAEPVRIQNIGQLLRPVEIYGLGETGFRADLKKTLNDFDRSKCHFWVAEGCHNFVPHRQVSCWITYL